MDPILFYYFCRICMVLAFALAIGDAATTIGALAYGGREANPVWRWIIAFFALFSTKKGLWSIARIAFGLLIVWLNVDNATAPFVWYAVPAALFPVLLLGYVVWSNWGIWNKLREQARAQYR